MVPRTATELNQLLLLYSVLFFLVDLFVHFIRGLSFSTTNYPAKVFNSISFATSVMLLLGVINPEVMKLLGDTTQYVLTTALLGVVQAITTLFKSDS